MSDKRYAYPVYKVYEKAAGLDIAAETRFYADYSNRAFECGTDFRMYTDDGNLHIDFGFVHGAPEARHSFTLLFDPAHSGRRPHNAFMIQVGGDGLLKAERYRYMWEEAEERNLIHLEKSGDDRRTRFRLFFPLSMLGHTIAERRIAGFNFFHKAAEAVKQTEYRWSGLPGDTAAIIQGAGDLLFVHGLSEEEIASWTDKAARESEIAYTHWKRQSCPEPPKEWIVPKKRGFTIRLGRQDAERARHQGEHTSWGRKIKEAVLETADYWAAKSDAELLELVPDGNPRALTPGQYFGDPLHEGNRGAFQMCLERPYEFYNPATGVWWRNGMKLTNPGTGEELEFHDGGEGFMAPDGFPNPGVRYMFTASYRLFLLSMLLGSPYCPVLEDKSACPETSGKKYAGAINNLAYAFVLTGRSEYACKALLLIGRIAELLPYMNGNYGDGTYSDTVNIAEPSTTESSWMSNFLEAADLLYDEIDGLSPRLQECFASLPGPDRGERSEPFCVKKAVYGMLPYLLYSCELEKNKRSDWSMRYIHLQLMIASFMGSGPLMQYVLNEGPYSLQSKIRNGFFRDGRYAYDSPQYIGHICKQMLLMANNNYRFEDGTYFPDGIDMFEDRRYGIAQIGNLYFQLQFGGLTPMFGDTSGDNEEPLSEGRRNGAFDYNPVMEIAFDRMPSLRADIAPILGHFLDEELEAYRLRSAKDTYLNNALLLLATARDRSEYDSYGIDSERGQKSCLLQDSETSILRAGTNARNRKHVVLYGQPTAAHEHGDKLGLWIGAYGYHLLSGAGRYPFTWISPKFQGWEVHSAACTIVVKDGQNQKPSYSRLKCHYEGNLLQGSGMENTVAYPGSHMERWCWLVTAPNGEDAYVVDVNFARGGNTFDYNTIGLDLPLDGLRFDGISGERWETLEGTMAGPDVKLYSQPGYGWMKAWKKAKPDRAFSWTFGYKQTSLRFHAVPDEGKSERELVCALGERGGEETGKSSWLPFVMWRDRDEHADMHAASFVIVLEPFEARSFIREVRPLKRTDLAGEAGRGPGEEAVLDLSKGTGHFRPVGIEIVFEDGRRDVVIANREDTEPVSFMDSAGRSFSSDGRALLLRYDGDKLEKAEAVGVSRVETGEFRVARNGTSLTGTVADADYVTGRVSIELSAAESIAASELEGRIAFLDAPDYAKPSTYMMRDVTIEGRKLSFRSEMPLILLDANWEAVEKKHALAGKKRFEFGGKDVYADIKQGDRFFVHRYVWMG